MRRGLTRPLALYGGAAAVFALTIAAGLWLARPPRLHADYLAMGSAAILLALLVLFVGLLYTSPKGTVAPFIRRRASRGGEPPPAGTPPSPDPASQS
jgi:hypothetical protein